MRAKIVVAALVAVALVGGGIAPARAGLWSGACALRVRVQFDTPARSPIDNPTYVLDVAGLADLDPLRTGIQSCATTLTGEAFSATSVAGSGSTSLWSCGAVLAGGSWHQSFDAEGPGAFSATHTLSGTWGSWTLEVLSPTLNVVGVGHFTLQAVEATKTPQCATGSLDSVTMVGEIVFQDP